MSDPPLLSFKLNPVSNVPGVDAIDDLVNVGLTTMDDTSTMQARLAEAVPALENGLWTFLPDGRMQTTWRIRPDVTWHDGEPFTSADLVFTTTIDQDRDLPTSRDFAYDLIESVDARDPLTITVTWKKPFIEADTMFSQLRGFPLPKHILESAYAADESTFLEVPYWSTEFVGTGPYRMKEWIRGGSMQLEANDAYVLGRPKVDVIEIKFIPDSNALVANILAGAVELTLGRSLSVEQAVQVRDQWPAGRIGVGIRDWIAVYPQMLNPTPDLITDVQFRRALMYALDRQEMADTLELGLAPVAHAYVSPNDAEYPSIEASIVRYEHDPRRATEMLVSMGLTRGPDGMFVTPSGGRLAIEVRTTAGDDLQEKAALATAGYWQRVGIPSDPLLSPRQRARDLEYRANFPGFELVRQPTALTYDSLTRFHGKQSPLPETNYVGRNRMRYQNAEFDGLIDTFLTTISRTDRVAILGQIVHHMTDQVIPLALFHNAQPTIIANRLVNLRGQGSEGTYAWNAEQWDVSGP
ncbi:MAG TPA: ABC transporter substrate-binding protein [Chloroflexota bacterium]|nr:ABC transporter substrate-binding protein [Chloroflexota bacterium]